MPMLASPPRPTLKHVARTAGVAVSTVARVLQRDRRVGPDLVDRVLRAIQSTHYRPRAWGFADPVSAAPYRGRGDIGAILLGHTWGTSEMPAALHLLTGVERHLAPSGRNLFIASWSSTSPRPAFLERPSLDGVILLHTGREDPGPEWIAHAHHEISAHAHVWLNARPTARSGDLCTPDHWRAGHLVAQHLDQLGHRCVGMLEPLEGNPGSDLLRTSFLEAALADDLAVVSVEPWLLVAPSSSTGSNGAAWVARHRREHQMTAVFSTCPATACALARALDASPDPADAHTQIITCVPDQGWLADLPRRVIAIDLRLDALCGRAVDQLLWRLRTPLHAVESVTLSIEPCIHPATR